jgi:DNA-directed RNA polymerase
VLSCIGDLFAGARDIQDWLTVAARLISRSIPPSRVEKASEPFESNLMPDGSKKPGLLSSKKQTRLTKELMSAVIWTTPLGLPVVQPYRKPFKKQVMTAMQTVYVTDPYQPTEVSTIKQASAFPPNFIHSLDATHMFMTALSCKVGAPEIYVGLPC